MTEITQKLNLPENVIKALKALTDCLSQLTERKDLMLCTGGFVRDVLLGESFNDIDLTLDEQVYDKFIPLLRNVPDFQSVGIDFTAGEEFEGKQIELFRFFLFGIDFDLKRSTIGSGIMNDVWKRDFTINSLYLNPFTYEVVDPKDYLQDIKTKTLRGVNSYGMTFIDRNRIIRAVRFKHKGFIFEPKLHEYMSNGAKDYMKEAKDPSDLQRFGGELRKCMKSSQYKEILRELIEGDLLAFLSLNKQVLLNSIGVVTLMKDSFCTASWKRLSSNEELLGRMGIKMDQESIEMRGMIMSYLIYFFIMYEEGEIKKRDVKRVQIALMKQQTAKDLAKHHKKLKKILSKSSQHAHDDIIDYILEDAGALDVISILPMYMPFNEVMLINEQLEAAVSSTGTSHN